MALLALQPHCVQLLQTYKHSDLNVGTDCRSTPHTHLSGGWPSKPQNARFQANMARWRPAAAPANKYSRLPAQEASLCACLSSALLHRALLGTLRGLWLATSSSTGISFLAMVNLLPLVLGASAQQATHQLHRPYLVCCIGHMFCHSCPDRLDAVLCSRLPLPHLQRLKGGPAPDPTCCSQQFSLPSSAMQTTCVG